MIKDKINLAHLYKWRYLCKEYTCPTPNRKKDSHLSTRSCLSSPTSPSISTGNISHITQRLISSSFRVNSECMIKERSFLDLQRKLKSVCFSSLCDKSNILWNDLDQLSHHPVVRVLHLGSSAVNIVKRARGHCKRCWLFWIILIYYSRSQDKFCDTRLIPNGKHFVLLVALKKASDRQSPVSGEPDAQYAAIQVGASWGEDTAANCIPGSLHSKQIFH